jgi:hypothetical protein
MPPIARHPRFRIRAFITSSGTAISFCDERGPSNSASSFLLSQVSSTWTSVSVTRRVLSISNSTDQPASLFGLLRRPVAGRHNGRVAFRSAAIVQLAATCARGSGTGGLLRGW